MLLLILSVLLLNGCLSEKSGNELGEDATPAELFSTYCADCHKKSGKGNFLEGIPPNRSTKLSDKSIIGLITKGNHAYPKMVVYPRMSKENAQKIVDHLRFLNQSD